MNIFQRSLGRPGFLILVISVAASMIATPAQARPSLSGIDGKLDIIDDKVDELLLAADSGVDPIPVTLVQRVNHENTVEDRTGESTQTSRICIGLNGCSNSDAFLADRIRQGSGEILVVTSITAQIFDSPAPPTDSYGFLNFGACRPGVFSRPFGIPNFTVDGRTVTHFTFRPGVFVHDLNNTERLCFASFLQSTHRVDVTLHGFLMPRP